MSKTASDNVTIGTVLVNLVAYGTVTLAMSMAFTFTLGLQGKCNLGDITNFPGIGTCLQLSNNWGKNIYENHHNKTVPNTQ